MLIWSKNVGHYKLKQYKKFKGYIKMEKAIIKFGDIEIRRWQKRQKIHWCKRPFSIKI